MIKLSVSLVSTAIGLVLLLSFKSHSAGPPRSALSGSRADPSGRTPGSVGDVRSSQHTTKKNPARRSGTVTGDPIDTPFGTMQVAAVIKSGRLIDVNVLQETDGGRSRQIDASAIPVLKSEALSTHSADIDVVSGATYTSQGYARSLQSALDKAGK